MGSIVGSIFGEDTPSAPNVQVWQPKNVGGADSLFYNTLSNQTQNNPYSQAMPQYQNLYDQQVNNPYAAGFQQAANNSGQAFQQQANANTQLAPYLSNAAAQGVNYGNQAAQMAFDPQNDLYNRTAQQLQDQVRTSNAARGINMSGYGAGLENQAMSNFNIDWQGQQLNRALAGLSGYSSSVQNAANTGAQASNIGTVGAGQYGQAGAVPYGAYNTNVGNQSNALNQLTGAGASAQGLQQSNLSQLLSYLGLGAQQSNSQGQFDLQNYQNQMQHAQQSQQGIADMFDQVFGGIASAGMGGGGLMIPGASGMYSNMNNPGTAGINWY